MSAVSRSHVFSPPLYTVDGGANGDRLAFLPVGRFLDFTSLSLFFSHFRTHVLVLSLSPPPDRKGVFFLGGAFPSRDRQTESEKGVPLEVLSGRYLEENSLFLARDRRNSSVQLDCRGARGRKPGGAARRIRGNERSTRQRGSSGEAERKRKRAETQPRELHEQRGSKRNCFVSESAVCVLA